MILSELKKALDKKFGESWHELENETISLTLGAVFDEKTLLKIIMLKSIESHPDYFYLDADYFLRFVEVANGNIPDAHHHDIPTCLELVYALTELERLIDVEKSPMLSNVTRYIINNEGHGEAYHEILAKYSGVPFTKNEKTKAALMYIQGMDKTKGEG